MPLSPEQVGSATFPVERQGYKKEDVRAFLALVASEYDKVVSEAAQAPQAVVELDESTKDRLREAFQAANTAREVARRAVVDAAARVKGLEHERDKLLVKTSDLQLVLDRFRTESDGYKAALEAHATARNSDSYDQLGEQVAGLLRSATTAADSVRAEAELHAAQVRGEAEDYGRALRESAEQILLKARQEADALHASADAYANDVQNAAQVTARQVRTEADAKARDCIRAAEVEATRMVSGAERKLENLRTTELQVRQALGAISEWVSQSLTAPFEDMPLKFNSMVAPPR